MPFMITDPFNRSDDELKRSEEQWREFDIEVEAADRGQRHQLAKAARRELSRRSEVQRQVEGSPALRGRR